MRDKVFFGAIAVAILILATGGWFVLFNSEGGSSGGSSGGGGSGGGGSSDYVTDAAGREVEIPDNLDGGIVTVGSVGPLRFLSIFGVQDKVIEVDDGDATDPKNGRAYSYAYDFSNVATHPDNVLSSETVEKIIAKSPSLVVMQYSVYQGYRDLAETMARNTTVVVVHAQSTSDFFTDDYHLTGWYTECVNLLGKVLNMEYRAFEHLGTVEYILRNIRSLIGSDAGVTYVAGVTFSGSNEWNSTFPIYLPINLTDGNNAYTGEVRANKVDLTVEQAVQYILSSDRIYIDPSSVDKLSTNNTQTILGEIFRINNDSDPNNDMSLYAGIPIVWDNVNYDCVLAASYYMILLQYGSLTMEELRDKIDIVFQAYYGEAGLQVFDAMCEFFVGKCASYNTELPLLSEVEVVLENGQYTLRAVSEA